MKAYTHPLIDVLSILCIQKCCYRTL